MTRRIIDLTLTLRDGMRGVAFQQAKTIAREGWNARTLHLYSHAGTHMDAPLHFIDGGATIDAQDLGPCVGPARVLELTHLPPRALISVEDLAPWHEHVTPGSRLLFKTGWSAHADLEDYRTHFQRIGASLARWLVEREVALIGVEAPSVADIGDIEELTEVHRILLGGGVVIVESLTNLDALSQDVVELFALPLKIDGGDGTPSRVIAIEG